MNRICGANTIGVLGEICLFLQLKRGPSQEALKAYNFFFAGDYGGDFDMQDPCGLILCTLDMVDMGMH